MMDLDYENESIEDIVDELVRMGLVKEVWHVGDTEPRYITTKCKGVE